MNKNKKGFTLTELIIVIVIIGILAGVLIPSLTGYVKKARISNDKTDAANMTKTMSYYMAENEITECNIHVLRAALAGTEYEHADAKVAGYSFWLDTNEKYVFLAKTDEAINGTIVDAASTSNVLVPEAIGSKSNFLYIDAERSDYNIAIDALYSYAKGEGALDNFQTKINDISNSSVKAKFTSLSTNLSKSLIISDKWMTIPNVPIEYVLFTPNIQTIPTNILGTNMNFKKGTNNEPFQLMIPYTVKNIKNNAFQYTNELILVNSSKATLNSNNTNNLIEVIKGSQTSKIDMPTYIVSGKWDTLTYTTSDVKKYSTYLPTISGSGLSNTVKSVKLDMKQLNGQTYYVAYAYDQYGRIIGMSNTIGFINEISKSIVAEKDGETYDISKVVVSLPISKLSNIDDISKLVVKINGNSTTQLDNIFTYSSSIENTSTLRIEVFYNNTLIYFENITLSDYFTE